MSVTSGGERQGGCKVLGTKGQPGLELLLLPSPSIVLCNEHRRKQSESLTKIKRKPEQATGRLEG